MAVIIASERSGVGKTTVALAILAAMKCWGKVVQSFKVGPDYIDPMYHTKITGLPCRNLDPILTSEDYVQECFARHAQSYCLIEGVMGLFDGATGVNDFGSTAHIAKLLDIPVVLVLNCSSISRSIGAIIQGYTTFDPQVKIAGVILNFISSDRHVEILEQAIASFNLPILGRIWRGQAPTVPERYLGLVPPGELLNLDDIIDHLAHLGKSSFTWDLLLPLLQTDSHDCLPSPPQPTVRLAVAWDEAFNFYYADNFDLLQSVGMELVYFSPLQDCALPPGVDGLYFGGGFPELFGDCLSNNTELIDCLQRLIYSGIPTYAECGGLMYLCQGIVDSNDRFYPLLNILPTTAKMTDKLTLGYRLATVQNPSFLCQVGEQFWGHEFHRSVLTKYSPQPVFQLHRYNSQLPANPDGWSLLNVHAAYVHLHFGGKTYLLQRWQGLCRRYQQLRCTRDN
ncbi:MAG: cobyrinate a,c-diamide synthase [Pseudanabaenaceae cyanobacterium SKYGB_i_bin29]|nr:cobyrinate a,c-diamide synthase [Pseudanabaenaceae cyanobacterium SKYG29]MDW8420873.1 cobyrinate a,c-diamide synthase [Pseudanabaenaceae cyanobacterium SKYGB_i_bin29]